MDIHIGDLHSTIVDRELEIVQELLEDVLTSDDAIGAACDVCAELDCLLSFAEASQLYEYQRPQMVDLNIIEIIQGRCACNSTISTPLMYHRHPLHERVVDIFVPNNARIIGGAGIGSSTERPGGDDEWNSVLLCTGANACGKVGLLRSFNLSDPSFCARVFT